MQGSYGISSYIRTVKQIENTMNNSEEFDIVIATLEEKKQKLWKMTQDNMNMDMVNLMDDIRLEQIQELNEAMGMWLIWKEEKSNRGSGV